MVYLSDCLNFVNLIFLEWVKIETVKLTWMTGTQVLDTCNKLRPEGASRVVLVTIRRTARTTNAANCQQFKMANTMFCIICKDILAI